MPSSLTVVLPSALVCSTRPRVSVCGTGATRMCLAGFLGSMITGAIAFPRGGGRTLALRLARRTSLPRSAPLRFNPLFRQGAAVSLLRRRVAARCSNGILTVSSVRLRLDGCGLGPDLPRAEISVAREPLALRRGGIPPPLSLLIPTFAFPRAPARLAPRIRRTWNAPLPMHIMHPAASAAGFIPDYYPRPAPRPVSCYALFE